MSAPPPAALTGQGGNARFLPCDVRNPQLAVSVSLESSAAIDRRSSALEVPGDDGQVHRTAMRGHPRHGRGRRAPVGTLPPDQPEQSERLPRRKIRKTKRAASGSPGCRRYRRRKPPRVVRSRQMPKAPADRLITGGRDGVAPGFGSWDTRTWSACMAREFGFIQSR